MLAVIAVISAAPGLAAAQSTIRASANSDFVSATNYGAGNLMATAPVASTWEQFTVVNNTDGTVSFRAGINGQYVSADLNNGGDLIANRPTASTWEKFRLVSQANGTVALQALANNLYVSADLNLGGVLVANRSAVDGWEQFTIATAGGGGGGTGAGNFPVRFAAPYVESWNQTSVTNLAKNTGQKFWTLAFVISNGGCTAAWNGDTPLSSNLYLSDINSLRALGGDVIVSFGGASGTELGQACSSAAALQAAYQAVITKYNLTWIDLDIEGGAIGDSASITRRNQAIHALELANPNLRVSYTLPVTPSGLDGSGVNLLSNAKANGARVDVVNVMAMDYGSCGIDMGAAAVNAAIGTRNQISSLGLTSAVGVTPMTDVNDTSCEVFSTGNSQTLINYAQANSYIKLLAYWAIGRDASHAHLNIFHTFH
ncbi:MAG TPA: glycosyl hydrolase family 18 protein [Kofleriaceae bacterium]